MSSIFQKRIGWLVLWLFCIAFLFLHLYLVFHGHPQNRGLTQSREVLIACDILIMATAGCFYRWGSILFWPTVGALIGSMVAVSGVSALKFTMIMMLFGFLFGLIVVTLRSPYKV